MKQKPFGDTELGGALGCAVVMIGAAIMFYIRFKAFAII